jgi:hypothetical protein
VLVHGMVDPFANHPLGPVFRLLIRRGSWALYERIG